MASVARETTCVVWPNPVMTVSSSSPQSGASLAGDHGNADELAVVRGAFDVEDAVLHLIPGACERLLQLRLVIDVTGPGELDPRVERVHHGLLGSLEPVLEIDGRDRCLEQGSKDVAAA